MCMHIDSCRFSKRLLAGQMYKQMKDEGCKVESKAMIRPESDCQKVNKRLSITSALGTHKLIFLRCCNSNT